jgi:hypothetical protein
MYRQSCYNYAEALTASPIWWCEQCGDMALNLEALGYCYQPYEDIRQQWLDYRRDADGWEPHQERE